MVETVNGWECIYCFSPRAYSEEEVARAVKRREPKPN
jgi:hypothetical protein